jgi:hypothetical protein
MLCLGTIAGAPRRFRVSAVGGNAMIKPMDRSLFDELGAEASTSLDTSSPMDEPSGIPFHLALLALSSLKGLGSKSLKKLSNVLEGDLGRLFRTPRDRLIRLLESCRIASAKKHAGTIFNNAANLIEDADRRYDELRSRGIDLLGPATIPCSS